MTKKQHVTLHDPKMYLYIKFWIPTLNQIQMCSGIDLSRTEGGGHGHIDPETVVDTSRPKVVSTYQIWGFMSYNTGDMLPTRFL